MSILYTRTFDKGMHRAVDFLLLHTEITEELAIDQLEEVLLSFEQRMATQPLSCQPCKETELLGVMGYREFHQNTYRVLYSVTEGEVIAMLFLHQKQSIQKTLIDHCLML